MTPLYTFYTAKSREMRDSKVSNGLNDFRDHSRSLVVGPSSTRCSVLVFHSILADSTITVMYKCRETTEPLTSRVAIGTTYASTTGVLRCYRRVAICRCRCSCYCIASSKSNVTLRYVLSPSFAPRRGSSPLQPAVQPV